MDPARSVAFVTGATSGLGKATVTRLLDVGSKVIASDISFDYEALAELEIGSDLELMACDITRPDQVQQVLDDAISRFGRLDVVVNCAGAYARGGILRRNGDPIDLEEVAHVINVNLLGTINVSRIAASRMATQGIHDEERGLIITVSSIAGLDGVSGHVSYAASKAGVAALTRTLSLDLASRNIRVMCIAPGGFETPMLRSMSPRAQTALEASAKHPARLGRPEEFADMVLTIMEQRMLNGSIVRLDGSANLGG